MSLLARTDVVAPVIAFSPQTQKWLATHKVLRIGVWDNIPQPLFVNFQSGVFEGLTADYLKIISSALGLEVIIQHYPDRDAMIAALKRGEVDLLAYYSNAANQENDLSLSIPYLLLKSVLVYRKDYSSDHLSTLSDSSLLYIGDEHLGGLLRTAYPKAKVIQGTSNSAAFAAVEFNTDTVMWTNSASAAYFLRQGYGDLIKTLPSPAATNLNATFATTANNAALTQAINSILSKIPLRSTVRIAETWGLDYDFVVKNHPLDLTPQEVAWLQQHPTIPVLIADTHAPFSFVDDNGKVNGFSIGLLDMIARRTGIEFEYHHFNSLYQMKNRLVSDVNAIIPVADSSRDNRAGISEPYIAYSRTYAVTPWTLVTRKDHQEIASLDDLKGHSVGVYQGAWFIDKLKKQYPDVTFIESKFNLEMSEWLTEKKIDAEIVPALPATYFLSSFFSDRYRIAAILPLEPVQLAMAMNKNNPILVSIINKALVDIPPQTIQAQMARWKSGPPPGKLSSWSSYRDYIIRVAVVAGIVIAFFLWRNALLSRNLAQRKRHELLLEQARNEADKANESKSIFLSQMSHEIRTPLNALTGLLELENLGKSTPQQRENNLGIAWDASKSLLSLVSDILDLAKIEAGSFTVNPSAVSLPQTVDAVMALFRQTALDKNIELITTLELSEPTILFDSSILRQIISNLVSNAIKFTDSGQVEVALYQGEKQGEQTRYILEVCDSGPGLDEQQQRAIFEPFVQLQSGRPAHTGTGLGLSICRQLAEILNGSLSVESELGQGATFIFRFDATPCEAPKKQVSVTSTPDAINLKNILIVDDHAPNRLLLSQQLEYAGHHTVAVESGQLAIAAWNTSLPDIVITDCNMPDMDGFELTRRLRQIEQSEGLTARPIFGLTAMAEDEVKSRAEKAGMTGCLFKPIELDRLLSHIEEITFQPVEPQATSSSPVVETLNKLTKNNPAAFKDLAETIIEQNIKDIQQLKTRFSEKDLPGIHHAAHQILGGARMIDSAELAAVCKKIEADVDKAAWADINDGIITCEQLVKKLDSALRKSLLMLNKE